MRLNHALMHQHLQSMCRASAQILSLVQNGCASGGQGVLLTPAMTAACIHTCDVAHPAMVLKA